MPRIAWVEDADAQGRLAEIYAQIRERTGRPISDILRTLSLWPDFLEAVVRLEHLQFSDGNLTRAQHEMIAIYVAALSQCRYCTVGHSRILSRRWEEYREVAEALRNGDLEGAPITPAERLLLQFVGTITEHAYRVTDAQVQSLRDVGWTDAQIAEAVYISGLFNMMVRIADAFGIEPRARPGLDAQ